MESPFVMNHDRFFKRRQFDFDDVVRRRYQSFRTRGRPASAILGDLLLLVVVLTLAFAAIFIVLVALAAALVIAPMVLLVRVVLRLINPPPRRPADEGTVIEVEYERRD
ncbi:MAG: hypothetical protein E2O89_05390 [Alphaproteobacteria bacterium]|nr:MAG: hypothetical protein E2O89_05390 [Alphaproteobacteria bacterium]